MIVQAKIDVTLGIAGPFLCSGTAPASWGLDATFDRDYEGRPYIDRSHIKGKLREAMEELGVSSSSVNAWFGKPDPMENGSLFFSDLRLDVTDEVKKKFANDLTNTPATKTLTRIGKDNKRRVVKPNAMLVMENAFPGSAEKSYIWRGTISYIAAEKEGKEAKEVAEYIAEEILVGLKWIAACGAEKSIGFGRLKTVEAKLVETVPIDFTPKKVDKESARLTLTIEAKEPLMLGDIRIKANYQESRDYITGSVLKGALAQAINTACDVHRPAATPIEEDNTAVPKLPLLKKYFSDIRFTHAFPSLTCDAKRPVVIPYSVVSVDGVHHDVALHKDPFFFPDQLPAFQTDWKDDDYPKPDVFGWARPLKFAKTRTAIDNDTRRADDGSMFTYQYVCPCDEDRKPISWIGGVYLDSVKLQGGDKLADLQGELECTLKLMCYLGKRASLVEATMKVGAPEQYKPAIPFKLLDTPAKDMAVVVLQSDALMVKAEALIKNGQTAKGLDELYKAYWNKITDGACELSHFFAMQKMRGGFLHRNKAKEYYPYYLTEAGSVFVLQIKNSAEAQKRFDEWDKKGLTLPEWALEEYGVNGKDVWKKCPYVPENGYGEVIINLDISALTATEEGGAK